jgi:MFS family permease
MAEQGLSGRILLTHARRSPRAAGTCYADRMDFQRQRGGLVGGVVGAITGILASLWWPPHSSGITATIAIATAIGIVLGLAPGARALGGTLFDSLWRVVGGNRSR